MIVSRSYMNSPQPGFKHFFPQWGKLTLKQFWLGLDFFGCLFCHFLVFSDCSWPTSDLVFCSLFTYLLVSTCAIWKQISVQSGEAIAWYGCEGASRVMSCNAKAWRAARPFLVCLSGENLVYSVSRKLLGGKIYLFIYLFLYIHSMVAF